MDPETLRYAPTHEWVHLDGDVATIGISAFAVEQLTDLVYIELPEVGAKLSAGDPFGEVESVKAVSDVYSPVDGEVIEVNDALRDDLSLLSADPYGAGWILKAKLAGGTNLEGLLDYAAYQKQVAEEEQ